MMQPINEKYRDYEKAQCRGRKTPKGYLHSIEAYTFFIGQKISIVDKDDFYKSPTDARWYDTKITNIIKRRTIPPRVVTDKPGLKVLAFSVKDPIHYLSVAGFEVGLNTDNHFIIGSYEGDDLLFLDDVGFLESADGSVKDRQFFIGGDDV